MGLSSLFRSKTAAPATAVDPVPLARSRARQRLIGAVVLLGVGIIGFPLLFETQPRPIPVDIPMEIPGKDSVAPLALPAPRGDDPRTGGRTTGGVVSDAGETPAVAVPRTDAPASATAADVGSNAPAEVAAAVPASPAPGASAAVAAPAKARAPVPSAGGASAPAAAAARAAEVSSASAPAAGRTPAPAAPAQRFVVQVGAFADDAKMREARGKVERLGLKTYTQVIDTAGGKRTRVRVGPFADKADAGKAAARIKAAGLPAAVLVL